MDPKASGYIMESDHRSISKSLVKWSSEASAVKYNVVSVIMLIKMIMVMVFGFIFTKPTTAFVSVLMVLRACWKLIAKTTVVSQLAIRAPLHHTALELMRNFVNPFEHSSKLEDRLKHMILSYEMATLEKIIEGFRHKRATLDEMFFSSSLNEIDEYWANKGLSEHRLISESKCVRFKTEAPYIEQTYGECFKLSDHIKPSYIKTKMEIWTNADMSDEMHTKSLHRRVAGPKVEPLTDKPFTDEFLDKLDQISLKIIYSPLDFNEGIRAALATQGTAGQFSKKSAFEQIWKAKNEPNIQQLWEGVVQQVLSNTSLTQNIPEEMVSYMLYRKREALEYDETGKVKITRLMNAPNLVARITDSAVMTSYNRAMEEARTEIEPTIGMNVFEELKLILVHNPKLKCIELDISDFDGGQTAMQMMQNCLSRVKTMVRNGEPLDRILYMRPRYMRHCHRIVRSTYGIQYTVLGSMASGDNTTSDDNSAKSGAMSRMINDRLKEKGLVTEIYSKVHGDDNATLCDLSSENVNSALDEIRSVIAGLGWTIKEEAFKVNPCFQNGKPTFLSHSVEEKEFLSENGCVILRFAVLTREETRMLAKMSIAAEQPQQINKTIRAKMSGKYLSFMIASLGNPVVMVSSFLGLIMMRSKSVAVNQPYSWQGLTGATIGQINVTKMIKLQLPMDLNLKFSKIKISSRERQIIKETYDMINSEIKAVSDAYRIKACPSMQFEAEHNWWDADYAISQLSNIMKVFERHNAVTGPESSLNWWSTVEPEQTIDHIPAKEGKVSTCGHYNLMSSNHKKYAFKQLCPLCWDSRTEKMYETINYCVYNRGSTN